MHEALNELGVGPNPTERQLRTAFKRLALEHHPDRNPDDPRAEERFKRIVAAYRTALRVLRGEPLRPRPRPWSPEPPPRARFRWGCGACGDSFAIAADCPRCERPLHDGWSSEPMPTPPPDPRVEALTAWLLRERGPSPLEPLEPHAPVLLCGAFTAGSMLALFFGPPIVAAELFAFGAYVAARMMLGHLRPTFPRGARIP